MLSDLALSNGEFKIAEESMIEGKDYNGLLLYYSCISNREKIENLAITTEAEGLLNISFAAYFQINNIDKCLDILIRSNRLPEAALFCRTYCPSKLNKIIEQWNNDLNNEETNNRISNTS
jgi:coatomer subunit beta'